MADKEAIDNCHETQSNKSCSGNTPPDRLIDLPLTPPATIEPHLPSIDASGPFLRLLESRSDRAKTVDSEGWVEVSLDQKQYVSLRGSIERSFKRFDYDPNHGLLILRIPSPVHDFFANILADDVQDRLNDIAKEGGEAGAFASRIKSGGSSTILLLEGDSEFFKNIRREPDAQFRHPRAYYPGVVVEVSYSQEGKSLRKLAQDYILYSNGDIKAVIGVNINYKGKQCTVSVWRPEYTRSEDGNIDELGFTAVLSQETFRSFDGSLCNAEKCLTLNLSDFATDALAIDYRTSSVSITFSKLFDILQQAEDMEPNRGSNTAGSAVKSERVTRKRRRSSSPEDRLRSDDERTYINMEKAAEDKASKDDEDFIGPITKRRVRSFTQIRSSTDLYHDHNPQSGHASRPADGKTGNLTCARNRIT
ncbi:hypothetical protein J3459_016284 [Metarhizium acridum]|nr:hypothetical protein J3459_016519 [Metarhizium acridum]KAG8411784.1 hypothetical protein J3459_016284 [Metarhizium acridum]